MVKSVRSTLKSLEVNPVTDARGRLALLLALTLDEGAGTMTAAVSKELRATLTDLETRHGGEDSDPFEQLLAELSAPMVDTTD
jgi:hypothetical protein